MGYPSFAYNNGLINKAEELGLKLSFSICNLWIKYKLPYRREFCDKIGDYIVADKKGHPRFNVYDIRKPCVTPMCYDFSELEFYLNRFDVQLELDVPGRKWESCNANVYMALYEDIVLDASEAVRSVLNRGLNVLIYNGDKDYICNWEGTDLWLEELEWRGSMFYRREEWINQDGMRMKKAFNLAYIVIKEAGHMVPMDQPEIGL